MPPTSITPVQTPDVEIRRLDGSYRTITPVETPDGVQDRRSHAQEAHTMPRENPGEDPSHAQEARGMPPRNIEPPGVGIPETQHPRAARRKTKVPIS